MPALLLCARPYHDLRHAREQMAKRLGVRGRLRRIVGIGPTLGPLGEQLAEFELVKAGEVEIKPRFAQLANFERDHLEIPAGVERQLVVGEHIGAALRRREVSQDDARHLVEAAVWSDSRGGLWITGSNSGDLFRYDSKNDSWKRWHLPGDSPQPYAVYVDDTDAVWVSDWGANAILRFDPKTEKFESFPLPDSYASVRQLAGRKGEVWGAESAADKLFVIKSE